MFWCSCKYHDGSSRTLPFMGLRFRSSSHQQSHLPVFRLSTATRFIPEADHMDTEIKISVDLKIGSVLSLVLGN
jgi:hypothetical protein